MKKLYFMLIAPFCFCALFGCNSNAEVTILFTTDVHGEIETSSAQTLTYSAVSQMKKDLINQGKEVLLLDSGDYISGGFYTAYDNGRSMIKLMNLAGYDAATLGNHEFDYNFSYLSDLINQANFPIISTNLYHMINNEPSTRFTELGSKIFSLNNGMNIGVIGVSTPDSITTSVPSHFQDEKGNYIYTFRDDDFYDVVQTEIDSIKNKCDYIICLSHLGDESQSEKFTATKLANNTSGINVILDGHTHLEVVENKVKDKNNNEVIISQANNRMKCVGKLTINKKDGIKTEMIKSYDKYNDDSKKIENEIIQYFDEIFAEKIATSEIKFDRGDNDTQQETNIGDLLAESPYYFYNVTMPGYGISAGCDVAVVNRGGIRKEVVDPGVWSVKTCYQLHTFNNTFCLINLKGEYLKAALEESVSKYPEYYGGFLNVCGVKFSVDSSKDVGNRVSDIYVYDRDANEFKALDNDKTYLIGGNSYTLLEGGDDIVTFKEKGETVRVDNDVIDYQALKSYISNFKKNSESELPIINNSNSPILEKYPNLTINYTNSGFAGRININ